MAIWLERTRHAITLAVRYAELPLPSSLHGWVVSIWTLSGDGAAEAWHDHHATPDGAIELIRRTSGRSEWRREQPGVFATGLSEQPIAFRFTGDAAFTGIKLWPWAWHALGGTDCRSFADDWLAIAPDSSLAQLFDDPVALLDERLPAPPIAAAILEAQSVGELARRLGWSHRQLQRWFAASIGLPPRRYLRLLRFRDAIRALPGEDGTLAAAAATTGYADQAHMARDFRALGGTTPSDARRRARGPFL